MDVLGDTESGDGRRRGPVLSPQDPRGAPQSATRCAPRPPPQTGLGPEASQETPGTGSRTGRRGTSTTCTVVGRCCTWRNRTRRRGRARSGCSTSTGRVSGCSTGVAKRSIRSRVGGSAGVSLDACLGRREGPDAGLRPRRDAPEVPLHSRPAPQRSLSASHSRPDRHGTTANSFHSRCKSL